MTKNETRKLFETSRLLVRQLGEGDIDPMLEVYGDAEAMRWVGDGKALDRDQCAGWIAVTRNNYATRGYGMSALVDRDSGEVAGFCGLVHPGGQPGAEIKYALRRRFQRRGLATEAAIGMLAYGAKAFGLAVVRATAAPDNKASHRVLFKAGMQLRETRTDEDGIAESVFEWTAPAALPVETSRFQLREYREDDRAGFVSYQTDPRFTVFHTEEEMGEQHAHDVFQLFLDWQVQAPRLNYQLAIAGRGDQALIGSCGVRMQGCQQGEAVFGIELAREYWGRFGYATEVALALIDWAFAQLDLEALIADTAPGNDAVARLAEWGGFKLERVEEKMWWRLTRADWQLR